MVQGLAMHRGQKNGFTYDLLRLVHTVRDAELSDQVASLGGYTDLEKQHLLGEAVAGNVSFPQFAEPEVNNSVTEERQHRVPAASGAHVRDSQIAAMQADIKVITHQTQ